MIGIYRKTSKSEALVKKTALQNGDWLYVAVPSSEEIQQLISKYKIPSEFIHACLDEQERPRMDKENGWRLVILRIPVINKEIFSTVPLGIITSRFYFITVCCQENPITDDFINDKRKAFSTKRKINFLLQIIQNSNKYFDLYVDKINREIDILEKRLLTSQRNEEVLRFLGIQKSMVYFTTAAIGNGKLLDKMVGSKMLLIRSESNKDLLEDLIIENKEASETLSVFNNILSNTMDAYASIISNNLNIVMKFLTSFTIILSIPAIIFGLYGMNVKLPFQAYSGTVYLTILFSAVLMLVLAVLFSKKKFF